MPRSIAATCLALCSLIFAADKKPPASPSFDYEAARAHEIQPHRRTIPLKGISMGSDQLHLTLTVSTSGDVTNAEAGGDPDGLKFWPKIQSEVRQWKFAPFEEDGRAVEAEIEEYVDLVPPERFPTKYIAPPLLRPNSKVRIALERTGCYGTCPSYIVTVSTEGIVFDGRGYVVAAGRHTSPINADEVRAMAKRFVAADFYSMDAEYRAPVTDNPTYVLSIAIDGRVKQVEDYVGEEAGMPAIISELEDEVDKCARTERWIKGAEGLVGALQAEKYNFNTFEAQVMLKEAAAKGEAGTVRELLDAGVLLRPLPAPKPKEAYMRAPFEGVGWLNAASRSQETLEVLIDAGASEHDQADKDLALVGAAESGNVAAARLLVSHGANPNVDLSKVLVMQREGDVTRGSMGGSALIAAAQSGNPGMVREILGYYPDLEARDEGGRTALFAVGDDRYGDKPGARAECARLLIQAGANVNARDNHGNTPLHMIFLNDVVEELLKSGADVNARNNDGDTPIFITADDDNIPILIAHGADLTVRNKKGQSVVDVAKTYGTRRVEILRKGIEELNRH